MYFTPAVIPGKVTPQPTPSLAGPRQRLRGKKRYPVLFTTGQPSKAGVSLQVKGGIKEFLRFRRPD